MTLKSMTGFGRSCRRPWRHELALGSSRRQRPRARAPVPHAFRASTPSRAKARSLVQEKLSRGNLTLGLVLRRESWRARHPLERIRAGQAVAAAEARADAGRDLEPASLDALLSMRGVVEVVEGEESEEAHANCSSRRCCRDLASRSISLSRRRSAEGERLKAVLAAQLKQIAVLVERAAQAPGRQPDVISARLAEQVNRLVETGMRARAGAAAPGGLAARRQG